MPVNDVGAAVRNKSVILTSDIHFVTWRVGIGGHI